MSHISLKDQIASLVYFILHHLTILEILSSSTEYAIALKLRRKSFDAQVILPNSSRIASDRRIHIVLILKKYLNIPKFLKR